MSKSKPVYTDEEYAAGLRDAQNTAIAMFKEIVPMIKPGVEEKVLSEAIQEMGQKRFGLRTNWHKRIIRSGPNTLSPFEGNPPNRVVEEDDILIVDLGPVFEGSPWEADFGRTYVLGDDPVKKRLRDALEPTWYKVKAIYDERPDMTGDELYEIAKKEVQAAGYEFPAPIAGHVLGDFPHERIPKDKISLYVTEGNHGSMVTTGKDGNRRQWILEIHMRDPVANIQGFYEQLLTV